MNSLNCLVMLSLLILRIDYTMFKTRRSSVLSGLKHEAIVEYKTPAASFLDGFKNERSYEFIGEVPFKTNPV